MREEGRVGRKERERKVNIVYPLAKNTNKTRGCLFLLGSLAQSIWVLYLQNVKQ